MACLTECLRSSCRTSAAVALGLEFRITAAMPERIECYIVEIYVWKTYPWIGTNLKCAKWCKADTEPQRGVTWYHIIH